MKKLYYLLFALAGIFGFASCDNNDVILSEVDEHADEVLVKLNIGSEICSDYSPLTRAGSTDDLIGIQVDRINSSGNVEAHFAYGLFDRLDNISIYLKKEYTYKVTASMVKDGKNKLYKSSYDGYGYYEPFYISNKLFVGTSFNYTNSYYFQDIRNCRVTFANSSDVSNYPKVDRLYGVTTNIKPKVGAEINLDLKRVSFGLKYEVAGLAEGTLNVKIEKKNTNSYTFVNATGVENGYKSDAIYYTFTDMLTAYERGDAYFENFTVTVSHIHSVINITEDLGSVDVKVYRNKMNNIKINLQTKTDTRAGSADNTQPLVAVEYSEIQ